MALPQGNNPTVDGIWFRPAVLTAGTTAGGNTIPAGCKAVEVSGVTTNADDYIILPALSEVPTGHEIILCANAGANFEVRTPATSNEKINDVDSDGTNELLVTDTHIVRFIKMGATAGWVSYAYTKLGAVVTAVIPDA
jgi:hypothetical protein